MPYCREPKPLIKNANKTKTADQLTRGSFQPRKATEISFKSRGRKIACKYWPGSGKPILAFHGWLDNAESFTPIAHSTERPILAIDFPGHGKSQHLPEGIRYNFADLPVFIFDVIEYLHSNKDFWQHNMAGKPEDSRLVLMGHSMGAGAVSLFAGIFPEKVEKIILLEGLGPVTSPNSTTPERMRKAIEEFAPLLTKKNNPYATFERAVKARQLAGDLDVESSTLLCKRNLRKSSNGYFWRYDNRLKAPSLLRFSEEQVCAILEKIQCPVLLVEATETLAVLKTHFIARVKHIHNLKHNIIKGGHHIHMQNAKEIAVLINKFMGD